MARLVGIPRFRSSYEFLLCCMAGNVGEVTSQSVDAALARLFSTSTLAGLLNGDVEKSPSLFRSVTMLSSYSAVKLHEALPSCDFLAFGLR